MSFLDKLFNKDDRPLPERFIQDTDFQISVLTKVNAKAQSEHDKAIKHANKEVNSKEKERSKRIESINKSKWQNLGHGVSLNYADGILVIDGQSYPLQNVQGAQAYVNYGEKHNYETVTETHKKPSLGKAVVGGAIFGVPGAVVGGLSGKSTSQSHTVDHVETVITSQGVKIAINGFVHDIPDADQSMVDAIESAVNTFDPRNIIPTEQLPEIRDMDSQILQLEDKVKEAEEEPLHYIIPDKYKSPDYTYRYDGDKLYIIPR